MFVVEWQKQSPEVFSRKVLKNSQNSQENTYTRVSFLIMLQAWDTDSGKCVILWILWNF